MHKAKRSGRIGRARRWAIAAMLLGASGVALAQAIETRTVEQQRAVIKKGRSALASHAATVPGGTQLTVLAKEPDGKETWLRVRTPEGVEGWVLESMLKAGSMRYTGTAGGGTGATGGAAVRPLYEDAEKFAAGQGYNTGPMNKLVKFREETMTFEEWQVFAAPVLKHAPLQ